MVEMEVSFGIPVDEKEARKWFEDYIGPSESMSDEECCVTYLEHKFNYGFGCEARVL